MSESEVDDILRDIEGMVAKAIKALKGLEDEAYDKGYKAGRDIGYEDGQG